jgi:phosphomannomutase
MNKPKLTVSGYRGVWSETLNEDIVRSFAERFAVFVKNNYSGHGKPKILIARDGRTSGPIIKKIILDTITSFGIDVLDQDIIPTPTVLFLVRTLGLDGAIIITASHNPIEYNGLKFVNNRGLFTSESEVLDIEGVSKEEIEKNKNIEAGNIFTEDYSDNHIEQILKNVDTEAIIQSNFKVFLDSINGAGSVITTKLLARLGCTIFQDNSTPNGLFSRPPEPTPANLGNIGDRVIESGARIGFVQDPDADRLVLIDEKGKVVSEELTVCMGILAVMRKELGSIVVNMSTTRVADDIAEQFGAKVFRTKVGEANVVAGIELNHAVIGGEGSGGIIYPKINMGRDSLTGIALILDLLAKERKPLSEIIATLPRYESRKEKYDLSAEASAQAGSSDLVETFSKLKSAFSDAILNDIDGLRFDWNEGPFAKSWIHIRPSNTEPIVRLIGESPNKNTLDEIFDRAHKCL